MMFLSEIVIELDDTVIAVSCGGVRSEVVASLCREVRNIAWPEVRLHLLGDRALRYWRITPVDIPGIRQDCRRLGEVWLRRLRVQARKTDRVLLLLEGDKPERLVLDDRASEREAVIFVAQRRLAAR